MRQLETHESDPLHKKNASRPDTRAPGAEAAGRRPDVVPAGPIEALPAAHEARSLRQATVMHMQRHHGNTFVQREIGDLTQEEGVTTPPEATQAPMEQTATESQAPVEEQAPAEQAPAEQAPTEGSLAGQTPTEGAPTQIGGDGSSVRAESGGVTIDGASLTVSSGMVNFNSSLVTTSGVLRTPTLVADTVVATAYTPGVGNLQ